MKTTRTVVALALTALLAFATIAVGATINCTDGADFVVDTPGKGGKGKDRISGGTGNDDLRSGRGDDRVNARYGRVDAVTCGRGKDRGTADKRDDVATNCEMVSRKRREDRAPSHQLDGHGTVGGSSVRLRVRKHA